MFLQNSVSFQDTASGDPNLISQVVQVTTSDSVVSILNPANPLFYLFAFLLLLAVAGIWYFLTRKAYPPRRHRRTPGKGPLKHFVDNLSYKISGFLS